MTLTIRLSQHGYKKVNDGINSNGIFYIDVAEEEGKLVGSCFIEDVGKDAKIPHILMWGHSL